jgi:hypothetical protein
MRRALHLGVQKALGVVASHYQVDLETVSTGYVVPVGVDDEVAMNRVDALAAPSADVLAEDFMDFLFPDAPRRVALKLENHWECCAIYVFVLVFGPSGHVINICRLKHLDAKLKRLLFISAVVMFCFPRSLG